VASVATLSFLCWRRSPALGAILYAAFFSWLWWHFICKGSFIKSDVVWLELPALLFVLAICIRAMVTGPNTPT
jgi:hypothetical protein